MTRPSSLRVSRRYLADYGYQEGHMPGDEDCPAHKIGDGAFVPADILDRPDWYTAFRSQLRYFWRDLLKAQGNANAKLTMYRALPTKYDTFNRGDWVSLSPQYAHGHAAGNVAGGPAHVIKATVPAKHLLWPGDDLMEWGYFGPKIEGEVVPEGRRASQQIAYHYSHKGHCGPFRAGTHFGTLDAARARWRDSPKEGCLTAVRLSIRKPLETDDVGGWLDPGFTLWQLLDDDGIRPLIEGAGLPFPAHSEENYDEMAEAVDRFDAWLRKRGKNGWQYLWDGLAERGYDGVEYSNAVEDPGSTSYIIFNPRQAKVLWSTHVPKGAKTTWWDDLKRSKRAAVPRVSSSSVNKWDLEDDLNDAKSKREVKEILRKHDAREVKLPNRETVWVLPDRKPEFVVEEWRGDWSVQEIYDYIWGADLTDIFPKSDERFNDDFWDYPAPLYHNTTEGNVEDIEAEGLLPMDKTRGISNRSTGSAVFTTSDPDESSMGSYGPVAYEIDTPAMKKDGYKPFVSQEEPIMEAELQSALASLLGMDDFYPDIEQGLSHYTVVVFGAIPPKYLTRVD